METILQQYHQGHCLEAYKVYGAHRVCQNGVWGVRFTVYAPSARCVKVVGDFNNWFGDFHVMQRINDKGDWSLFIEHVQEWALYKYRIETPDGEWVEKSDPVGFYHELRPKTASIVTDLDKYTWQDDTWMQTRKKDYNAPMSIYEVHLGSWRRNDQQEWQGLKEWTQQLIPYVLDNGFTHIELLPMTEHPFDGSWGYQTTGYYAVTSRYGNPYEIMEFIDLCHQNGLGVILDVVMVHFVKDKHGLALFDGTPLYEYRFEGDAQNDWGTLNFDLWKEEVRSFLMSSLALWCEKYHIDGLRFDAVSNLIYWQGNKNRGLNNGAMDFVKRTNYYLSQAYPDVYLIAEDSSDYQGVTKSTLDGGLGFDYKWDLGWMNDTLKYYKLDPIYRQYHHNLINFSMFYFYFERFMLPFSHDEVVHMKGSIINKLWGNYEQKFSQARNLMGYMFAHPGKKLNFMGNEIGSFDEWKEYENIAFDILKYPAHSAFLRYFKDLNEIYKHHPSLYQMDYDYNSFRWIDADNAQQSIFSFVREVGDDVIVCVLNMTPTSYEAYKIGVPYLGTYTEILNSEKDIYHGYNMCNFKPLETIDEPLHGFEQCIDIRIAPFACIYFTVEKKQEIDMA